MIELSLSNAVTYSVQILLFVLICGIGSRLIPRPTALARFAYWRAAVAACLLLPILATLRAEPVLTPLASGAVTVSMIAISAVPGSVDSRQIPWAAAIAWLVALGIALRLLWLAAGMARLHRLRAESAPLAVDEEIDALRRGLAFRAQLRTHAAVQQPIAFGFRRPIILFPSAFETLTADTQRAVACHELLHVSRCDWLWMLVEEIVRTVFWFHPAMRWSLNQLQLSREEVVDAKVVQITGVRRAYMNALLMFAGRPALTPATLFARRRHLSSRIRRIAQEVHMSRTRRFSTAAVLAGTLALSTWAVASALPLTLGERSGVHQALPSAQTVRATLPVVAPPKVVGQVQPVYPADLRKSGAGATVTLVMTVDGAGQVTDVRDPDWKLEISGSSTIDDMPGFWAGRPWQAFVDAAESAFRRWTFEVTPTGAVFPVTAVFRPGQDSVMVFTPAPPPPPPPPPPPAAGLMIKMQRLEEARALLEKVDRLKKAQASEAAQPGVLQPVPGSSAPGQLPTAAPPSPPSPDSAAQPQMEALRRTLDETRARRNGASNGASASAPSAPVAAGQGPLRVGGAIAAPRKIFDVRPVYPDDARAAGVSGVVILETHIAEDGSVKDTLVLRSIPMLDQAAIDAVMQWRFEPTLLNGEPVEVIMVVTVNFTLS